MFLWQQNTLFSHPNLVDYKWKKKMEDSITPTCLVLVFNNRVLVFDNVVSVFNNRVLVFNNRLCIGF